MPGWALMASLGAQAASKPMIGVSGFKNTATGTHWRGGCMTDFDAKESWRRQSLTDQIKLYGP